MMIISKSEAHFILISLNFLFQQDPEWLIISDYDFCKRVFDEWPDLKKQFIKLSEAC